MKQSHYEGIFKLNRKENPIKPALLGQVRSIYDTTDDVQVRDLALYETIADGELR